MIVRDAGEDWLLIRQQDHAELAAALAAAVVTPPALPDGLGWTAVVGAVRRHDDGWQEHDAAPVWSAEHRRVRNFDQYSMVEATTIWRDSVRRTQALVLQPAEWFDRRIDRRMYEWVCCAVAAGGPQSMAELRVLYQAQVGLPVVEAELTAVIDAMRGAGALRSTGDLLELDPWHRPRAELSALWVSRHFDHLAEHAEQHRHDRPDEVAACTAFRMDHRRWTESARNACSSLLTDAELTQAAETGYRAVQLFDRLSLELCLQTEPSRHRIETPGWPSLEWELSGGSQVRCSPALFGPEPLFVTVPARRVAKDCGRSAAAWDAGWKSAVTETLIWKIEGQAP